jgi:hypothetical protein
MRRPWTSTVGEKVGTSTIEPSRATSRPSAELAAASKAGRSGSSLTVIPRLSRSSTIATSTTGSAASMSAVLRRRVLIRPGA